MWRLVQETLNGWQKNMAGEELHTEKYENLKTRVELLSLEEKQKNKLLKDEWSRKLSQA